MNQDIKSLLLSFNQKPIAYHKAYTQITGRLTAGVMLSQLMYWWSSVKGREFYKTDDELREETGLSIDELKPAKKLLKNKGFITYKLKGIPAKTNYIINIEKIINELTSLWKSHQLESGNPTNCIVEIPPTITENTQENTTDIKNPDKSENSLVLKEEVKKKNLPLGIKDDLPIGNPHPPVAFTPLPLKEADEVHELYKNLFNSKKKSKVWYKNFVKWRETYSLEDIKTAITLWHNFGWIWDVDKDRKKPDLELLFRHSNKAGECDYIGQLLDTHQDKKVLTYKEELEQLENRLIDGEIDTGDYEILHRKLLKKYDR